jgi:hypothetical protein
MAAAIASPDSNCLINMMLELLFKGVVHLKVVFHTTAVWHIFNGPFHVVVSVEQLAFTQTCFNFYSLSLEGNQGLDVSIHRMDVYGICFDV